MKRLYRAENWFDTITGGLVGLIVIVSFAVSFLVMGPGVIVLGIYGLASRDPNIGTAGSWGALVFGTFITLVGIALIRRPDRS